jgi:hypothetical protein
MDDPLDNKILRPSSEIQEDVDYKLLPDDVFDYLFNIYGGSDIRRYSIELASSQDQDSESTKTASAQEGPNQDSSESPASFKKEYLVETQLHLVKVYIIPRISYYPTCTSVLKMPFNVYTSR